MNKYPRVVWVTLKSGERFPFTLTGPSSDPRKVKQALLLKQDDERPWLKVPLEWSGADVASVEEAS